MIRRASTLLSVLCVGSAAMASLIGCGSSSATAPSPPPATATATSPTDRRTRSLDLIVPESTSDPAALDDAALNAAIDAGNRRVNELTGQSLRHAAEYTGNDLSRDPAYRKLLVEMKAAETELGRLEMERDRRVRKR